MVEVLYFTGCPHADDARALVRRCVAQLGLDVSITERDGDYPSPSVLVNGQDVMGPAATSEKSCRLDLPTEARIVAALKKAVTKERS